jgi:hypothetical protein
MGQEGGGLPQSPSAGEHLAIRIDCHSGVDCAWRDPIVTRQCRRFIPQNSRRTTPAGRYRRLLAARLLLFVVWPFEHAENRHTATRRRALT